MVIIYPLTEGKIPTAVRAKIHLSVVATKTMNASELWLLAKGGPKNCVVTVVHVQSRSVLFCYG